MAATSPSWSCSSSLREQEFEGLRENAWALWRLHGDEVVAVCRAEDVASVLDRTTAGDVVINCGTAACDVPGRTTIAYGGAADRPNLPEGRKHDTCVVYCDDEVCTSAARFLVDEADWVSRSCARVAYLAEGTAARLRSDLPVTDTCRAALRKQGKLPDA